MRLRVAATIFSCLVLFACGHKMPPLGNDPYKNELHKYAIGNSKYYIDLPTAYNVKLSRGIDFDVYYFYPKDTANKIGFRGGMYFGNSPHMFDMDSAKCKADTLNSPIFGEVRTWDLYKCGEKYTIQTIAFNNNGSDWDKNIHVFGKVVNKIELHKLMVVFSTLEKQ